MKKYLRVEMPDGVMYDIPAEIIAEHRARYFEDSSAEKLTYHASSIQPRLHRAEKEFALENDEVLIEWASEKMEWKDLKYFAKKVEHEANYDKDWKTAPKKVVSD